MSKRNLTKRSNRTQQAAPFSLALSLSQTLHIRIMNKIIISLLGFVCITVFADSKSNLMSNDALGKIPSTSFPKSGAEYWERRAKAVNLSRKGEWEKAIPLLTSLTREYKDDGDTWFMLGHGYLQTQQCQKAIPVLKQVLELGTIMTGIKSASSPSNDIVVSSYLYSINLNQSFTVNSNLTTSSSASGVQ